MESDSDDEIVRKSILDVMEYDRDQPVSIYPIVDGGDDFGIAEKCNKIYDALILNKKERDKLLIDIYAALNVKDREFISKRYQKMYGVSLRDEMEKHLDGSFGHLIGLLSVSVEEAEVIMIDKVLKSSNRDNLSRIICGRSNKEIEKLQDKYYEINSSNL